MIIFEGNRPAKASAGDAGYDLIADETVCIVPGEFVAVGTGTRLILEPGTVGLVHPRSGLAVKHGITVLNAPGTIDSGYHGEIKVILINHNSVSHTVEKGDRIAQLVVQDFLSPMFVRADDFDKQAAQADNVSGFMRGSNGFGSSGQ